MVIFGRVSEQHLRWSPASWA